MFILLALIYLQNSARVVEHTRRALRVSVHFVNVLVCWAKPACAPPCPRFVWVWVQGTIHPLAFMRGMLPASHSFGGDVSPSPTVERVYGLARGVCGERGADTGYPR